MGGGRRKPRGRLRIGSLAALATALRIPALSAFQRAYPDITIAMGISDRPVNIVGEGVDCVIRAGTIDELSMVGRKLLDLTYATRTPRACLARMGTPRSPADLASHVCLGYSSIEKSKPKPLRFEAGGDCTEVDTGVLSANDSNDLLALMCAGMRVGQQAPAWCSERGELVRLLPEQQQPSLPFLS